MKISHKELFDKVMSIKPRGRDASICGRFEYGNYSIQIGIRGGDNAARQRRFQERKKVKQ